MNQPPEDLPCPFCGSRDISDGELLITDLDGSNRRTQSECRGCGAHGPTAPLDEGDVDYGSVKAIAAWNRRTA